VFILLFFVCSSFDAYLDSSLAFIGLTRNDLVFRNDYSSHDPYRLAIVDSLLMHPMTSIDFALSIEEEFWDSSQKRMLGALVRQYGFDLMPAKGSLFDCLSYCHDMIINARGAAAAELGRVFEELIIFTPEPTGSIEEEKAYERRYDSLVNYLSAQGEEIDYERIFGAALTLLQVLDDFSVTRLRPGRKHVSVNGVSGNVLHYEEFNFGRVVVGDSGNNTYTEEFAVIIDLGGDDTYNFGRQNGCLQLVIDETGDDDYQGGDFSIACGMFGVSIIIDNEGDDKYEAHNFSLGAGVFGIGILIDRTGNDRYFGDTFTQGAGGFGIGILRDEEGNDTYEGALYAQGFASTYGVGILGDGQGNDHYLIREKYLDEIRYLDHYLSMSQGFSIGFRPDLSAGIGMLLEGGGNDYYICDIFGQGASYWYGLGAIVEKTGNDSYIAYQYAQGSGTHVALGLLIDEAGDDNYVAKGVSQGCGHDLSLGLLFDRQGSDTYAASDLSQGAGNANGIGILIDETGDDAYVVKRLHNTQGYGDFRRDYGSIGVLMDLAGDDHHTSGDNQDFWQKGKYGIGIDWH